MRTMPTYRQSVMSSRPSAFPVGASHDRCASNGHMVRDARRCRAPHHEGFGPHPELRECEYISDLIPARAQLRSSLDERALARVSKDGRESECCLHPSRRLLRKLLRMRSVSFASSKAGDPRRQRLGEKPPLLPAAASSPRRETQHPLQMLITLRSSSLPCSLTVARVAARRDLDAANRVRFILTALCTGNVR
jgi:hypothetical protein